MNIIGIAKSRQAGIRKTGKPSSKKDWKLSDSLREKIAEYAREDAAQNVYMGNKFLALRKSEVAKVAPDRSALMGKINMKEIRAKGTWTLQQYEGKYRSAMYAAVKAANPKWEPGQPFDPGILDSVTRESVENQLVKSGNTFVKKSSSGSSLDIQI